jgi:IS4 transposase
VADGDGAPVFWFYGSAQLALPHKYRRFFAVFLICVACLMDTYWLYLQSYYANEYPRTPNVSIGRIVPLNVHGTVV